MFYKDKKSKNAYKKRKSENFVKPKNALSQGSFNPKITFLGQKLCSVARMQTNRQTDMKVNTEAILSRFQQFFLQPIIKDYDQISSKSND